MSNNRRERLVEGLTVVVGGGGGGGGNPLNYGGYKKSAIGGLILGGFRDLINTIVELSHIP